MKWRAGKEQAFDHGSSHTSRLSISSGSRASHIPRAESPGALYGSSWKGVEHKKLAASRPTPKQADSRPFRSLPARSEQPCRSDTTCSKAGSVADKLSRSANQVPGGRMVDIFWSIRYPMRARRIAKGTQFLLRIKHSISPLTNSSFRHCLLNVFRESFVVHKSTDQEDRRFEPTASCMHRKVVEN